MKAGHAVACIYAVTNAAMAHLLGTKSRLAVCLYMPPRLQASSHTTYHQRLPHPPSIPPVAFFMHWAGWATGRLRQEDSMLGGERSGGLPCHGRQDWLHAFLCSSLPKTILMLLMRQAKLAADKHGCEECWEKNRQAGGRITLEKNGMHHACGWAGRLGSGRLGAGLAWAGRQGRAFAQPSPPLAAFSPHLFLYLYLFFSFSFSSHLSIVIII